MLWWLVGNWREICNLELVETNVLTQHTRGPGCSRCHVGRFLFRMDSGSRQGLALTSSREPAGAADSNTQLGGKLYFTSI